MARKTHDARHSEQADDGFVTVCECGATFGPDADVHVTDREWRAHYDELTPKSKRFDAGHKDPEPDAV
jgi:hypothetical protein